MIELTKNEAYAVAEFIDGNIFDAIRNDIEWDSFQNLRNLVHAYEKCCKVSGYVGLADVRGEEDDGGVQTEAVLCTRNRCADYADDGERLQSGF